MKEKFKDSRLTGTINIKMDDKKGYWQAEKMAIVNYIISICEEYLDNGDTLTLRQLYYQLVSKDLIPNHDKVYKKIGSIKDDIVYSGLIDWETFEDRGRVPQQAYYEDNVAGALERTVKWYNLDKQDGQPIHLEVWTEKDAISGILKSVTDKYTVRMAVNKGYTSSTAIYNAYERFCDSIIAGKQIKILYFGDHDPSGLDMIRDIKNRLEFMFVNGDRLATMAADHHEANGYTLNDIYQLGEPWDEMDIEDDSGNWMELFQQGQIRMMLNDLEAFEIIQIGLTMEQIKLYNPPHNPAKMTDPRAKWYIEKFGAVSWEVDALPPNTMRKIVKENILSVMDEEIYLEVVERQKQDKAAITKMIGKSK